MGGWLLPSVLALIVWGFWGFLPKLASNSISPMQVSIYQGLGNFLISILLLIFVKFKLDYNIKGVGLALLSGFAGTIGSILYNYAAKHGKISSVVILTAMYPIITILLSVFILHEKISVKEFVGMALAMVSILLISL